MSTGTMRVATVACLCALVWFVTSELPAAARALVVFLLVILPVLMLAQARTTETEELPRLGVYISSALSLWLLAAVTAWIASRTGFDWSRLGFLWPGDVVVAVWTAALLTAGIGVVLAARALGMREAPLLAHLLPRTATEKFAFAGLSVTAGICEELVFRGFLLTALYAASGSWLVATLLSAGAFGLVHAYQRPAGALRAGTLGLLLSAPLIVHGTIWPAIVAHAALDLIAGLLLRERLIN